MSFLSLGGRTYGVAARAAWRTARAMGPATRPPVTSLTPGWPCTITATATRGASAGAKAIIHACDDGGTVPSWAVPVLAATCTPGMLTDVAVPRLATSIIMSRTWPATVGSMAVFHGSGL